MGSHSRDGGWHCGYGRSCWRWRCGGSSTRREYHISKMWHGKMPSVAIRVCGHDFVFDVMVHQPVNLGSRLQEPESVHQRKAVGALRFGRILQFANHPQRRDEMILPAGELPPLPRPFPAGLHLHAGPRLKVKARNTRLDINEVVHGGGAIMEIPARPRNPQFAATARSGLSDWV